MFRVYFISAAGARARVCVCVCVCATRSVRGCVWYGMVNAESAVPQMISLRACNANTSGSSNTKRTTHRTPRTGSCAGQHLPAACRCSAAAHPLWPAGPARHLRTPAPHRLPWRSNQGVSPLHCYESSPAQHHLIILWLSSMTIVVWRNFMSDLPKAAA